MSLPCVVMTPLRKLRPSKYNVRTHSKKQIRQIANSILRFGWTSPILTDENGYVIAGEGRRQASDFLGLREVPVIVLSGLSDTEKRALALADNKIAANAGWDRAALAAELGELAGLLPEYDLSLEITGFEPAEIDTLLGDLKDPDVDPSDEVPPLAQQAISKTGDLWQLGRHRLLCGNALSADDLRRVMGSELAALVITDPPYNVSIKSIQGRGRIKHREFAQASGEMTPAQFTRFLRTPLSHAAKHSIDGAIHFVFMDWRHMGEMLAVTETVYSELKNLVVWTKTNAGQGTFYRSAHELIFVCKVGDGPHINNFELGQHGRYRSNVWTYAGVNTFRAGRLDDLSVHPTVKPVALVADAIRDCSRRGDIVLDPFIGSGTTILAAERVGRRGYGIEIDPLYVDAAVRRWQSFTKQDAVLESTGQTFDELAAGERHSAAPGSRPRSVGAHRSPGPTKPALKRRKAPSAESAVRPTPKAPQSSKRRATP